MRIGGSNAKPSVMLLGKIAFICIPVGFLAYAWYVSKIAADEKLGEKYPKLAFVTAAVALGAAILLLSAIAVLA